MRPRATWFCVDIECSGPVPALYDLISLGIVAVHERPEPAAGGPPGRGFVIGATDYVEVKPTAPRVDPGAMKVNGLDLEALRRDGLDLPVALDRVTAFVERHLDPGTKPVFVGHNAPFDWSFVSFAYHAHDRRNPFGYKALDTKALAAGVLGLHWFDTDKERLQALLDLPEQDRARVHRADYDAEYQARILVGLLRKQPADAC